MKSEALETKSFDATPICVDLDGSLVCSDTLVELVLALLREQPLYVFVLPLWLLYGKSRFKDEIARRVALDARVLPYNAELLDWLRRARAEGRPIWLCTAAHERVAHSVAEHLDLFDGVIATSAADNLSGRRKTERLVELFGAQRYDYVGNARVDLPVWSSARCAIVADAQRAFADRVSRVTRVEQVFPRAPRDARLFLRAIRVHQWLKNLLVFVPLGAAHLVGDGRAVAAAILAFVAFSLCASGVYLINDLLDLESDRRHPRKRERPFASGRLPLVHGAVMALVLLVAAAALSLAFSPQLALVLAVYFAATMLYSLRAKRIVMVDVVLLSALYTLRIIAGTVAIGVPLSFWLLAFSMFLFLSLALVKRHAELLVLADALPGRGYRREDTPVVMGFGAASGFASVLVLALYINSPQSAALYERPEVIWLLCPLLMYWIMRMWLKAHRGEMHDDPVVFAVTDRVSLFAGALGALIVLFAL